MLPQKLTFPHRGNAERAKTAGRKIYDPHDSQAREKDGVMQRRGGATDGGE